MSAMRLVIGCKYHADDCVEMILYGEDDNNSVTSVFHRGIDAFLREVSKRTSPEDGGFAGSLCYAGEEVAGRSHEVFLLCARP